MTEITRLRNAGFLCACVFPSLQNLFYFCSVERGSEINNRSKMLHGHRWPCRCGCKRPFGAGRGVGRPHTPVSLGVTRSIAGPLCGICSGRRRAEVRGGREAALGPASDEPTLRSEGQEQERGTVREPCPPQGTARKISISALLLSHPPSLPGRSTPPHTKVVSLWTPALSLGSSVPSRSVCTCQFDFRLHERLSPLTWPLLSTPYQARPFPCPAWALEPHAGARTPAL